MISCQSGKTSSHVASGSQFSFLAAAALTSPLWLKRFCCWRTAHTATWSLIWLRDGINIRSVCRLQLWTKSVVATTKGQLLDNNRTQCLLFFYGPLNKYISLKPINHWSNMAKSFAKFSMSHRALIIEKNRENTTVY